MNAVKWLSREKSPQLHFPMPVFGLQKGEPHNVIVGLHGFGDNANNFATLANEIPIDNVLWLFVEAPFRTPMAEGKQWFSLFSNPDKEIQESQDILKDFIDSVHEQLSMEYSKIYLFGFSQGAAMSILCGLMHPQQIGGVFALSGFMYERQKILDHISGRKSLPAMFLAHGVHDQVLFPAIFFEIQKILSPLPFRKFKARTYAMGHSFSDIELRDLCAFFEEARR